MLLMLHLLRRMDASEETFRPQNIFLKFCKGDCFTLNFIKCVFLVLLLDVSFFPNPTLSQDIKFVNSPENQTVVEQEQALFVCSTNINDDILITWFMNDVKVTFRRSNVAVMTENGRSSLRVMTARKRDQGSLVCKISNSQSNQDDFILSSNPAYLNVLQKNNVPASFPKIAHSSLAPRVFEAERQIVLAWKVDGDPKPKVSFVKDHFPLNVSEPRLRLFTTDEGLYGFQVDRAQVSDSGKYECVATSDLGSAYSPAVPVFIKKREVPPYFSIVPEHEELLSDSDVNLTCVAVGSPMPLVRWFNGSQELNPEEAKEGRNVLQLKNVQVSSNLTCLASSELGEITWNVFVYVKALPDEPTNVRYSNITPTSAHIQWILKDESNPVEKGNVFSVTYQTIVNGTPVENSVGIKTSEKQVSLTNLKPFTEYLIGVKLQTNTGSSKPAFTRFTTEETDPSTPPTRIRASAVGPTSISLAWEEPTGPNGIIKGYKVYLTNDLDLPTPAWMKLTVTEKTVLVNNLVPGDIYKISISAFTSVGDGPQSDPISIMMKENAIPEHPEGFTAVSKPSSIVELTWQHSISSDVTHYILNYKLIRSGDNETDINLVSSSFNNYTVPISFSEHSHTVQGLLPFMVYKFRIAAKSSKGMSPYTNFVEVETFEEVPSSPPENVRVEALDSTSVKVTWSSIPKGKRNGRILGYRLLHSTLDPSRSDSEVDPYRAESGVTMNIPYPEHSTVLRNLRAWSKHKFKIAGYTSSGDGPWSHSVIVETFEDVPGVPRKLRVVVQSSTTVMVMWRPPQEQNGFIQGYQIYYLELDKNEQPIGNQLIQDVGNGSINEALVGGLKPGTIYDFQVAAYTRRGDGARSKAKRIKTMTPSIGEPQNFRIFLQQVNPSIVLATWEPPLKSSSTGGSIQGYKLLYQAKDSTDDNMEEMMFQEDDRKTLTKVLSNGIEYEFQIMAKSLNEFGPPAFASLLIPEGVPLDSPQIILLKRLNPSTAHLSWALLDPEKWNGRPIGYRIRLRESGITDETIELTAESFERALTLNSLKSNVGYDIQMSACTRAGCGPWSDVAKLEALYSEGSRKFPGNSVLQPPDVERISSATALVKLNKSLSEMPSGKYYLVVVKEDLARKQDPQSFPTSQLISSPRDSQAWICGQFLSSHFPVEFLVGDGLSDQLLTNRKLNLDNFAYRFFTRLVSPNGADISSAYSAPVGAPSVSATKGGGSIEGTGLGGPDNFLIILGPVCVALLLVLIIIFVIACIKRRSSKSFINKRIREYKSQSKNRVDTCEVPLNPCDPSDNDCITYNTTSLQRAQHIIQINQLAEKLEELKTSDRELLRIEYESIDSEKQFTWAASNLEENRHKNRYANVVAYDHSRVVLQALGYPGSGYINANYIDGHNSKNAYIATQGPMPDTFEDFWRMIWECNCSTIVMITRLEERNRVKCDQYWPERGSDIYGRMQVALKDTLELASYTVRTFSISMRDFLETREVFHLQFTSWPDHGVPEYPTLLLQFIRRVKAANNFHRGPVVVHCSAGVGRTGALIAIDLCLDHMAQYRTVDVLGCVTKLRSQRNYMVQSDDQYQFIYEAVLEAVQTPGETEIPADQLCAYIQELKVVEPKSSFSRLTFEYQRLSVIKYDQSQHQTADLPFNKNKNRNPGVFPMDSTRVCLQPIRGVDGSDYINASFVDGYRFQQMYIAAQAPSQETTNDFWRMVWENNCSIIVMLINLVESGIERCHQYWPSDRSMRYQYFVLDLTTVINVGQYIVREFRMTDARDGQSRAICHFQFTEWSLSGRDFSASGQQFINFIGQVENMRAKIGNNGPIAVHCCSGAGRTGVFVALSYVLERMRTEGVVNLFETAKILRTQRPFMIQTEEQYAFCYQAASEYLGSFDHYTK